MKMFILNLSKFQLMFTVVTSLVVLSQVFDESEESIFIFQIYMLFNTLSVILYLFGDIVAEEYEIVDKQ